MKLKTVLLMLIIGFLFLMYDALDDRFSRRTKKPIVHDTGHHDDASVHGEVKKKKSGKKHKKVIAH